MATTNKQIKVEIRKHLLAKLGMIEEGVVQAMHNVGLEALTHARKNVAQTGDKYSEPHKPTYTVRTGNLVSSTGYTIVKDGEVRETSDFAVVQQGAEGSSKGKQYAAELAANSTHGISLIMVAGMDYAKYVQAKGYDVLDSAQLLAEKSARQKIQDAIKAITS